MLEGLTLGWRTAVLTVVVGELLVLAIALLRCLPNRSANRTLAALLMVMAALVMPWLIGFSGFYDKWQWLTFAPFQITLAAAPLAWLYLYALIHGEWPDHGWRHLLPALVQGSYLTLCFALLPLEPKQAWAERSSALYDVITGIMLIAQMALYGRDATRRLGEYRAALADHLADEQRFAVRWLSAALGALALLFAVWTGYLLWDLIAPLGYRGLMGLYLAIAAAALYLGIEGWRHAALPFPQLTALTASMLAAPDMEAGTGPRDWTRQGEEWRAAIVAGGWARDPELTLARVARHLGTNTGYLSRAINQGLGLNFAAFIADLRARAVAERLRAGDPADLLTIALEEGFGSKASFNRSFAAALGMTPSAYRRGVSNPE